MPGQVDLPRLKHGKAGGAFWSAVSLLFNLTIPFCIIFPGLETSFSSQDMSSDSRTMFRE